MNENQIRQAFRAAITAAKAATPPNTALVKELRALRGDESDPQDKTDELNNALDWLDNASTTTAVIAADRALWDQHMTIIRRRMDTMPTSGNRSTVKVRNKCRALMVDATAPAWLKEQAEKFKRTTLCDTDNSTPPKRQYDQKDSGPVGNRDPISVLGDAATAVIENMQTYSLTHTAAEVKIAEDAAMATISRWRRWTPSQPV